MFNFNLIFNRLLGIKIKKSIDLKYIYAGSKDPFVAFAPVYES